MATIKDNEHQPDVQECDKTALDGSLASGSSTMGMTDNVNPDNASTETGFSKVEVAGRMTSQREGDELTYVPTQSGGGVVGRPGGWER